MTNKVAENTQVFKIPFAGECRLVSDRIRAADVKTTDGEKRVVNFTVYPKYNGEKDNQSMAIEVALWGSMAEQYEGLLAKGQVCFLSGILKITDSTYEKDDTVFPQFRGNLSVSNFTQFTLYNADGEVRGDRSSSAAEPATTKATKSVVDNDDVPF